MKNLSEIKTRFLKESSDRRLGHLASDLSRIYGFLKSSQNKKVVEDVLEETKFFIEWTAPDVTFDVQVLLSEMQSRLALWHLHLTQQKENPKELEDLKKAAKTWSERLLKFSGLLAA